MCITNLGDQAVLLGSTGLKQLLHLKSPGSSVNDWRPKPNLNIAQTGAAARRGRPGHSGAAAAEQVGSARAADRSQDQRHSAPAHDRIPAHEALPFAARQRAWLCQRPQARFDSKQITRI